MKGQIHPAFYVANWIFFSNLTIVFNKWLLDTAGFRYPLMLTTIHLVISSILVHLLDRFTPFLASRRETPLTTSLYFRTVIPISILYTASLALSNLTYLYLSVAFVQQLKAAAPVITLLLGWAVGVSNAGPAKDGEAPRSNMYVLANVLAITVGVVLSSAGELRFSWIGFVVQMSATVAESGRLLLIQVLLLGGQNGNGVRLDPLVGLYYYAPPCALLNGLAALAAEAPSFKWADLENVGWYVLVANGLVAFLLNVASVSLIGKSSALAMNLTGILKSILLVAISLAIWPAPIDPLQAVGYSFALVGLFCYSIKPADWERLGGCRAWLEDKLGVDVDMSKHISRLRVGWTSNRYTRISPSDEESVPLQVADGRDSGVKKEGPE